MFCHHTALNPAGKPSGGPIAVRPTDTPPPPAVVTLTVPAEGPVAEFARLVDALDIRDYRLATAIRRGLYRAGWSIVPPRSPSWQRGRS